MFIEGPGNGIDKGITRNYTINMKTAISIPDEIFKEVENAAKKNKFSRSEFITLAVREYLERIKHRQLFEDLNKAYSEEETEKEISVKPQKKKYYARRILREKY
jgi:Arc/MetJ-type ribon-helix-helix transcriptional regulator